MAASGRASVRRVQLDVDAGREAASATFADFSEQPYFVRPHYIFNSASVVAAALGQRQRLPRGRRRPPVYDFSSPDQAYDAIIHAGHRLLVELGFTPRVCCREDAEARSVRA